MDSEIRVKATINAETMVPLVSDMMEKLLPVLSDLSVGYIRDSTLHPRMSAEVTLLALAIVGRMLESRGWAALEFNGGDLAVYVPFVKRCAEVFGGAVFPPMEGLEKPEGHLSVTGGGGPSSGGRN